MSADVIVGVTAKSFLGNQTLCKLLMEQCSGCHIRFADAEKVDQSAYLEEFLADVTHWIVGREPVSAKILAKLARLSVISKYGVGLDNIDFEACRLASIDVRWRPGVNAQAVAELTIGLMINLCRNVQQCSSRLAQGIWSKNGGVAFSGKTVGIIGAGAIGSRVARLARSFACSVLICDILPKEALAQELNGRQVGMDELLEASDLVTLHVPLTNLTHSFFDASKLLKMRPHAFLVNTSRGEVVDQEALKSALKQRHIAGAALDVYTDEPLDDKDLYSLDNFIGTAHIGGNSREAVLAMGQAAIDGVKKKGYCLLSNES